MLKDWYLEKHNGSGPLELIGKLTYNLMGVHYSSDPTKACRAYLYYKNPNADSTLNKTDSEHPHCIDYRVAFNPANLIYSDSHTVYSFVDQIKEILEKAEKVIADRSNSSSSSYSGEYYLANREFTVSGTTLGMLWCKPTGDRYEVFPMHMNALEHNSQLVPVSDVNIGKLLIDAQQYLDYEKGLIKSANQVEKTRTNRTTTLLNSIQNLSLDEMVASVNTFIKRKKLSITSLIEMLVEEANNANLLNVASNFYSLTYSENWLTKDGKSAYKVLDEAFKQATYDNGKPLSGYNDPNDPAVWHDYFEHYDRDQDYETVFDEDRVIKLAVNNNEVQAYLEFTEAQLINWVKQEYGNSPYDHDFN